MRRIAFGMDLEVLELINVPMFDDTQCYIVSTISNDKIKNNYKKLHISSYTTPPVPVKNHRVNFGKRGMHSVEFRLQAQAQSTSKSDILSNKWLCMSFMLKHENRQELLGSLTLNLTDYVNDKNKKELRFLLENSKTNTIIKLNLLIRHLSQDENVTYQTSKDKIQSPHSITTPILNLTSDKNCGNGSGVGNNEFSPAIESRLSLSRTKTPQTSTKSATSGTLHSTNQRIPSPKAQRNSASIMERVISRNNSASVANSINSQSNGNNRGIQSSITSSSSSLGSSPNTPKSKFFSMSPISPQQGSYSTSINGSKKNNKGFRDIDTQLMMNEACENAVNDISLLDELINRTYRFTWQLKTAEYEEFTPSECVKDIIEKNGNGWKKNDEGMDMVDIVETEFKENTLMNKNKSSVFSYSNNFGDKKYKNDEITDDVFADFKSVENVFLQESDDDSDDYDDTYNPNNNSNDIFNAYYRGGKHKSSKVSRYKPLTEAEVREDLRSWHITVK